MVTGASDEWVRYWRPERLPAEAMRAHFAAHVYHRHSHETYSLGVTESGAQAFSCRNGRHVSTAGLVMAFNPDDPHDGHAADTGGFTYQMVHIDPAAFGAGPRPLFREPVLDDPAVAAAVRTLIRAIAGPASALTRDERLAAAVALLRRHASAAPYGRPVLAAPKARQLAGRIRSLIHEIDDPDMAELAAAAGCSRYTAYRAFEAVYGLAPSDYQRQVRIRMARTLLAAGVPAATAAARAGFADQAHLTRWFRRYYGITPGAYAAAIVREDRQ